MNMFPCFVDKVEVEVKPSEGKGMGLFAGNNIPIHSRVISDKPLFSYSDSRCIACNKPSNSVHTCKDCAAEYYCSAACKKSDSSKHNKICSSVYKLSMFKSLITETNNFLHSVFYVWVKYLTRSIVDNKDYKRINSVATSHVMEMQETGLITMLHLQFPPLIRSKITIPDAITAFKVCYDSKALLSPDNRDVAVFPKILGVNHSCLPNAIISEDAIYACRDIPKGTEITINYLGFERYPLMRRRAMLRQWNFQCTCPACIPGAVRCWHEGAFFGSLCQSSSCESHSLNRKLRDISYNEHKSNQLFKTFSDEIYEGLYNSNINDTKPPFICPTLIPPGKPIGCFRCFKSPSEEIISTLCQWPDELRKEMTPEDMMSYSSSRLSTCTHGSSNCLCKLETLLHQLGPHAVAVFQGKTTSKKELFELGMPPTSKAYYTFNRVLARQLDNGYLLEKWNALFHCMPYITSMGNILTAFNFYFNLVGFGGFAQSEISYIKQLIASEDDNTAEYVKSKPLRRRVALKTPKSDGVTITVKTEDLYEGVTIDQAIENIHNSVLHPKYAKHENQDNAIKLSIKYLDSLSERIKDFSNYVLRLLKNCQRDLILDKISYIRNSKLTLDRAFKASLERNSSVEVHCKDSDGDDIIIRTKHFNYLMMSRMNASGILTRRFPKEVDSKMLMDFAYGFEVDKLVAEPLTKKLINEENTSAFIMEV